MSQDVCEIIRVKKKKERKNAWERVSPKLHSLGLSNIVMWCQAPDGYHDHSADRPAVKHETTLHQWRWSKAFRIAVTRATLDVEPSKPARKRRRLEARAGGSLPRFLSDIMTLSCLEGGHLGSESILRDARRWGLVGEASRKVGSPSTAEAPPRQLAGSSPRH